MTRKEKEFQNVSCNDDLKKVIFLEKDLDLASEFVTRLLKQDILIDNIINTDESDNEPIYTIAVTSNKEKILLITSFLNNADDENDVYNKIYDDEKDVIKQYQAYSKKIIYLFLNKGENEKDEIETRMILSCKSGLSFIHTFSIKKAQQIFKSNNVAQIDEWDALVLLSLSETELQNFAKREAFTLAFYENLKRLNNFQ